jgi:hypothetical protein
VSVVVGTVRRFRTFDGQDVRAVVFEERATMPRFDVEVVAAGEVVEHFTVLGAHMLDETARRRRWIEVGS